MKIQKFRENLLNIYGLEVNTKASTAPTQYIEIPNMPLLNCRGLLSLHPPTY